MKTPPVILSLLFVFCVSGVNAQTSSVVTLEEAIQMSLQKNKSITAASLNIDFQKQIKRTSSELPKTDINLMYGQYNSNNSNDNNLSISQRIPFPTVFSAQHALGQANVKAAELRKSMTEMELIYQVKRTYYQLHYLKAFEKLLLQQDSVFKQFARSAELRFKTGESTLLEKTTAETQANEMQNLLRQTQADQRMAAYQLQTLLFSEHAVTSVDEELSERAFNMVIDSSMTSSNPNVSFYKQQVEIATREKNVEVAKALPDFRVGYFNQTLIGYQRINNEEVYFGSNKRFQGFEVGLGIPLWYAPHASRIRAMKYSKAEETANFEAYKTNFQNQLMQAAEMYSKNKNNLMYYKTSAKPNADLIISQTQKAFQQGDISYAEHVLNLRQAITIQVNYLEALNSFNQSVIYLEYLSGIK